MDGEREAKKKAKNRERAALRRAMESEGERKQRLEASRKYSAEKRAKESDEKKAERRLVDRKRAAERRARESQWEREQRLTLGRQRAAQRRAMESDEKRESRLAQNRERLATKRALKARKLSTTDGEVANSINGYTNRNHRLLLQHPIFPWNASGAELSSMEAELTSLEAESAHEALSVAVEAMATGGGQQTTGADQAPAVTGGNGGEEKSSEVKQEVLEIKEFRAVEPNLERHYNDLLKVISEIGRDVKPAYTNNKVSTDRLRKNIMMARGIVRECVQDVDRLAAASSSNSSS